MSAIRAFRVYRIVIARSAATKQSRERGAPYVPLDCSFDRLFFGGFASAVRMAGRTARSILDGTRVRKQSRSVVLPLRS